MKGATAKIRDLRTDFRAVKRMLEAHDEVVITDNGIPRYVLKPLPPPINRRGPLPDYYARLLAQRARPLSLAKTAELHQENRGDR